MRSSTAPVSWRRACPGCWCPRCTLPTRRSRGLNRALFSTADPIPELREQVETYAVMLEQHVAEFINTFNLDRLIVENALAIPMNVPLGLALYRYLARTHFPTIAHDHDYYWERSASGSALYLISWSKPLPLSSRILRTW